MDTEKENEILIHYGIKGMRWGVRRKRGKGGRVSQDHKKSRVLLKKPAKKLSNAQIKKINQRLQLERQLSDLDPRAKAHGRKAVSQFMKKYQKVAIGGLATGTGAATAAAILKRAGL